MRAFYFGCWKESGHHLRFPGGEIASERSGAVPFSLRQLDGGFCPPKPEIEGAWRLTWEADWTVLSIWDRSVDSRHGSHSTYLFEGTHEFAEAVALAKEHFPTIWARYKFELHGRGY